MNMRPRLKQISGFANRLQGSSDQRRGDAVAMILHLAQQRGQVVDVAQPVRLYQNAQNAKQRQAKTACHRTAPAFVHQQAALQRMGQADGLGFTLIQTDDALPVDGIVSIRVYLRMVLGKFGNGLSAGAGQVAGGFPQDGLRQMHRAEHFSEQHQLPAACQGDQGPASATTMGRMGQFCAWPAASNPASSSASSAGS